MFKSKLLSLLLLSIPILLILHSCFDKDKKHPDVTAIKTDFQIWRFDLDLGSLKVQSNEEKLRKLKEKYGSFFDLYLQRQIVLPGEEMLPQTELISRFLNDGYVANINEKILHTFPNNEFLQKELNSTITYIEYYFPAIKIKKVLTANSLLNQDYVNTIFIDSQTVLIFLDQYLGAEFSGYDSSGYFDYMKPKMDKKYLAKNMVEQFYNVYFGDNKMNPDINFLQAMIEQGKKYYLIECLLPEASESLIAGYSEEQLQWCKQGEKQIWQFFNDKDLLYKTNLMEQKRYLMDAPTSHGMPPESPGNTGSWLGWQIVKSYMSRNSNEVSLQQLMVLKPDNIFKKSNYQPK